MKPTDRRSFVKSAGYGVSLFYIAKTSWAQTSPGDTIHAGVIGFNGRGRGHISGLLGLQHKGVRLTSLCDVDSSVLARGISDLKKKKVTAKGYTDLRKMLEDKDLDVVTIATPNHWHSLAAIWAIQAGKDVYVEKPVSHNVWEGRQVVNAARKYRKIVQTGTQSRSSTAIQKAVKWTQDGGLGKIEISRGLCYKLRSSIGKTNGPHPVPAHIDYDIWCGPAPLKAPTRNSRRHGPIHYDWHWMWDYGNGDLGNQGIHQMDIARWFLGKPHLAPKVWSLGGRLGYVDDAETPNTQIVYHDYEDSQLIFEVRGLPASAKARRRPQFMGAEIGVVVHCEGGHVLVSNTNGKVQAFDKKGKEVKTFSGSGNHFDNFISAVRSRNPEDLNAEILEGHLSSALCHTGNISYRLGEQTDPDTIRKTIVNDPGAAATFDRLVDHLKKNNVDPAKTKLSLGPTLKMNTDTERFIGNSAANKLLTREYREPYVVPLIG
ncbi:MAG: putative dehydrogenase [Limisphaerales bacterium]|jgi:predicted dehydrogenase